MTHATECADFAAKREPRPARRERHRRDPPELGAVLLGVSAVGATFVAAALWAAISPALTGSIAVTNTIGMADVVPFPAIAAAEPLAATLGVINLEQNQIIKVFAAVVLLPPTLIATIYGINFKQMPELK